MEKRLSSQRYQYFSLSPASKRYLYLIDMNTRSLSNTLGRVAQYSEFYITNVNLEDILLEEQFVQLNTTLWGVFPVQGDSLPLVLALIHPRERNIETPEPPARIGYATSENSDPPRKGLQPLNKGYSSGPLSRSSGLFLTSKRTATQWGGKMAGYWWLYKLSS